MSRVSLYCCDKYELSEIKPVIRQIIEDNGGFEQLFRKGKRTVIKPNLVMKKTPDEAATTHPAVIEAIIELIKPYTDDITIAECPGGPNTEPLLNGIYKATGMTEVAGRQNVRLSTDMTPETVEIPDGAACKRLQVLKTIADADVFINVGKLKGHSLTFMTGTAKNLYGLVPGLQKVENHARFPKIEDFARFVCDLNRACPPTLSFMDAVVGMEGNGPTGGSPRKIGAILGGVNTFDIDSVACALINYDVSEAPILSAAQSLGLCSENVETVGANPDSLMVPDFKKPDSNRFNPLKILPNLFGGRVNRLLEPRPKINKKKCIGCGECMRLCPQKTITVKSRKAKINRSGCIKCYCCQELCPQKAVDTKSPWFLKF